MSERRQEAPWVALLITHDNLVWRASSGSTVSWGILGKVVQRLLSLNLARPKVTRAVDSNTNTSCFMEYGSNRSALSDCSRWERIPAYGPPQLLQPEIVRGHQGTTMRGKHICFTDEGLTRCCQSAHCMLGGIRGRIKPVCSLCYIMGNHAYFTTMFAESMLRRSTRNLTNPNATMFCRRKVAFNLCPRSCARKAIENG